jgi:hypothetical protein
MVGNAAEEFTGDDEDEATGDREDLAADGDDAAVRSVVGGGEEENLRVLGWGAVAGDLGFGWWCEDLAGTGEDGGFRGEVGAVRGGWCGEATREGAVLAAGGGRRRQQRRVDDELQSRAMAKKQRG